MLACDIPWSPHLKTLRRCAEPSCIWLYTLEMGGLRIKPWMTKIPPSLCIDWVGSSTIERGNAMDNREYIKSLSLQGTSRSVYKQNNICWQRNRKMNNNGKRNQSDQPPVWPLSTREPMANEAPAKGQTHPVARVVRERSGSYGSCRNLLGTKMCDLSWPVWNHHLQTYRLSLEHAITKPALNDPSLAKTPIMIDPRS